MNIELIKSKLKQKEILLSDIFDTIVYRKNFPDYNKKLWCKSIKEYFNLKISLTKLIKLREETEITLRKENQENGYDLEFNYNDLIDRLYNKLNIPTDLDTFSKISKKIEVDIESNSQEVFEDTLELFNWCKDNGKKIVCVSDMYLTKEMLRSIFEKHNINEYIDDIIVSSQCYYNKITGNLFKHVAKKYNVAKALMIGDNYWYDCFNPSKEGIASVFIDRGVLFNRYNGTKEFINNKGYLKKLRTISSFNNYFNEELENFENYCLLNSFLYKNNVLKVYYTNDNYEKLERLILLNRELYYSKYIDFIESNKNTLEISDDNIRVIVDSDELTIPISLKDINCFLDIMNVLANVVYDKEDIQFKKQHEVSTNEEIPFKHLEQLGKEYTPLFEDFVRWINDELEKNNINKVYFFTREGEFFKKVFDKIKNKNITSDILEVSRVATFLPSLKEFSIEELMKIWNQYSIQSISALYKSINVDIRKYLKYIYKYNLNISNNIIYPFKNKKVIALFNDEEFKKKMDEEIAQAKEKVLGYFSTHKLQNTKEKIAIVDIGWRGTIQDNVCNILNNKQIFGYYFGLQNFLNIQPKNSKKFGYINRFYCACKVLGDITPFEMLCNSCNGSTIGYVKENDNYIAQRKIDEIENLSYYNCTKYIQESVIQNVGKRKYNAKAPIESLNKIIYNPSKYVAKTYFNLKHNEEFGLGEYVSKKIQIPKKNIYKGLISQDAAMRLKKELEKTSWPNGYLVNNNFEKHIDKLPLEKINEFDKVLVTKKIAWIMPDLLEGSGGHRTIIENANYLVKKGYQCDLYFNEDVVSTSEEMTKKIKKLFGECLCQVFVGIRFKTKYDMIFATYSVITPEIVKNSDCKHKMYFLQDYEPWFNPMGDGYISAENSYRYGFTGISIGNWLAKKISSEFSSKVYSFPFCANLRTYHKIKSEKENALCFVFQPDKPRRCVELGLKALRIVKASKPDLKIYLYGSKLDYWVDFEHENLKIISTEECNKLYNKCKVGLCISSSNPSRVPFEMMAAGLPVVDVYRENNLYDMPAKGVTLAESTPESIANEIINLLNDEELLKQKSKFGLEYMKDYDINVGFQRFYEIVTDILNENEQKNIEIKKLYTNKPSEISEEVKNIAKNFEHKPYFVDSSDYHRNLVKLKYKYANKLQKHKILYRVGRKASRIVSKICNKE